MEAWELAELQHNEKLGKQALEALLRRARDPTASTSDSGRQFAGGGAKALRAALFGGAQQRRLEAASSPAGPPRRQATLEAARRARQRWRSADR